jgi:WD40 repeat protein/serine/threonine protein kinase
MSNQQEPRPGQQVGEYRLLCKLGGGGFGTVYLAEHVHEDTLAAVKMLNIPLIKGEDFKSFLNEASTIRLHHPHIVSLLNFGISRDDLPFLVMEYAPGGTLRDHHPKGERLPLPTIISYVDQLASALQYAHNHHIIHRDVKPENILVRADGTLLISDFGIAKLMEQSMHLSEQKHVGTPIYMAPEQYRGYPCFASDQYALAVVIYELICGTPPFQGPAIGLALQHMDTPPPPLREQLPELPAAVEQVIFQALAKAPEERFRSIQEFADALRDANLYSGEQCSKRMQKLRSRILAPVRLLPLHTISNQIARPPIVDDPTSKTINTKPLISPELATQVPFSTMPSVLLPAVTDEKPIGLESTMQATDISVSHQRSPSVLRSPLEDTLKHVFPFSLRKRRTDKIFSVSVEETQGIVWRDWGEAPDVPTFFGRAKELALLEQWITQDRCRLVALVGMKGIGKTRLSVKLGRGGIGKTDLSLKLARGIQDRFDYVIWRRLLNAPKVSELLADLIKFLSNQQEVHIPDTVSGQISRLLHYLQQSRCLVILDNVEMILQGGKQAGQYYPGYEEYGQLLEKIAELPHQSCLLLTSREKPPEVARREGQTGPVRSLEVRGLDVADGQKILAEIGSFSGSKEDWRQLNHLYNGNPLALELAARHIKEVFFGSITEFLREGKPTFADLRSLLDWHFNRLADTHKEVMYWFAINREPTALADLKEDILSFIDKEQISSTLESLQRLIPLEKSGHSFTLQPVLIEYMTRRFVEQVVEEVRNGGIQLFNTHALLKTSVSDYVRDIQSRTLLQPVIEKLLEIYGNQARLAGRLKEIVSLLREERFRFISGYAGGNILNLLCYLKFDLRGYNFSSLAVWQAYLQGVSMQEVNFTSTNFARSVFTDTFGTILCVAFSPQRDLLATGTATGEIRVWYAASGLALQTFRGHSDWVFSVAFSPNGKILASASLDQTVRLWDIRSGKLLNILQGHTNEVYSVAFSPDGKTLASGSYDQTVRLWDISSSTCTTILRGHRCRVHSAAFSPDGKTLASGSDDQTVRLWGVCTGRLLKVLRGHTAWVYSVAFSPDGKTLASSSQDQTVRLWEVGSGRLLKVLRGHSDWIRSVTFSPDGRTLASSSLDQTVRLWEVSSGQCLKTLQGHTEVIWSAAFSSDGRTLASGSFDQTVRLWEVSSGRCLKTLQGHTEVIWSVAFSPDDKTLVSGHEDRAVRLWDISSGQCLKTLQGHTGGVWSVALSSDGKTLASGSEDRTVRLWEVGSGTLLNTLRGHTGRVWSVAFSPDGKTVASGSQDQTVCLWEVSSGKLLNTLRGHSNWVWPVAFSPDGKILASGSYDQTVRLWEVNSGTLLNTLQAKATRSLAFSPDGKTLASGSQDQTVYLWEVNTGKLLNTLHGHSHWVSSVAFSPCGKILASGNDQIVCLWEVSSGQLLNTLHSHSHWVSSVAFSPTGKTLASSGYDGIITLWDGSTGIPLHTLRTDRPYERMNITRVTGLTEVQKDTLRSLGAIEDE